MIKILQFPLLSSVCRSVHPSFSHVFLFHLSLTPSLPPSPPPPPHIHLPSFSLFPHRSIFPSIWCSALSISIHPSFLLCFLGSCLIFSSPFISLLPSYNLSFSVLFPFPTFFCPSFFHSTSFFSFLPLLSFTHSILLSSLLLLLSLLPVPAEEMLICQPPGLPELRLYDGGRGKERERDGKRGIQGMEKER